jgi:hypothetical protein
MRALVLVMPALVQALQLVLVMPALVIWEGLPAAFSGFGRKSVATSTSNSAACTETKSQSSLGSLLILITLIKVLTGS